ncbi:MAG TPA: hypothetical protein PK961_16530 [bacterium]|nr:hypothetical protein [bacterium]
MRKIELRQAQPGDRLAQPIENNKGIVLCGAGTELTQTLIDRFERMEIASLWVESDESINTEQFEKMKAKVEQRFSLASSCPIGQVLKEIVLERLESRVG